MLVFIMPIYREILKSSPTPEWFESLPLPEGETWVCVGRQEIELDKLTLTNDKGQITNIARAKGTDKEHSQEIAGAIKNRGVLLDAQPPYVTTSNRLIDGYTRTEAIRSLGFESWVYNVVEPKEGFTEQDVWDDIGLGANDHPPAKRATRSDFTIRLKAHLQTLDPSKITEGYCLDWIERIPHSFSKAVVNSIASKCVKSVRAAATMESLTGKDVAKIYKNQIEGVIVPINISGNIDYFRRAAMESMRQISIGKDPVGITYVNDTEADELESVRNSANSQVDRINAEFEALFQRRLKEGENFKVVRLNYHAPQVLGAETSLIEA